MYFTPSNPLDEVREDIIGRMMVIVAPWALVAMQKNCFYFVFVILLFDRIQDNQAVNVIESVPE